MIRVDFYHLQRAPLEQVLPKLCEKAYATGKRIKILLGTEERVEFINSLLWTYNEESFLPHGSKKDGFAEEQPIFISANEDNANNASLLILADGAMPDTEPLTGNCIIGNRMTEEYLNKRHKGCRTFFAICKTVHIKVYIRTYTPFVVQIEPPDKRNTDALFRNKACTIRKSMTVFRHVNIFQGI